MTISQGIYDKMAKVLGNFKGKKAVILANFNFKIALYLGHFVISQGIYETKWPRYGAILKVKLASTPPTPQP